jgi:hypothetical protein
MNVYIKNFKDDYMFTFDGKDWDIEKKDVVLNNMIENKKNFLESKFDDVQGSLPQYAITMFKKFLERSDDNEVIDNIKDEMKNMFYKNRNHVIKNVATTQERLKKNKKTIENNLIEQPQNDIKINGKKSAKKVIMKIEQIDISTPTDNVIMNEKKPKKKANTLSK